MSSKIIFSLVMLFAGLASSAGFNISLELVGNCSPGFTLICRHSDVPNDPSWIHNRTVNSGEHLKDAFPGLMYILQNNTEHRLVSNGTGYNDYSIQCAYSIQGNVIKSNAVTYYHQPPPKLHTANINYPNATITYSVENCSLNPQCVRIRARARTRVEPADNVTISEEDTSCTRTVGLSQLERCRDYRLDILSEDDTVLLTRNLTAPPGNFTIDYCAVAGQLKLSQIGLRNLEPDCPDFAGEVYRVEVDGEPVAHVSATSLSDRLLDDDRGDNISGLFQLMINSTYILPENASTLTVTRLSGEANNGEVRRFPLPCSVSDGNSVIYSLFSLLPSVLLTLGSGIF